MKDIRVDSEGEFRCWNCGNKGLLPKRTFRSKMLVGVGALLTKKKLKCQTCGEYNDTGNAKAYAGPENRKWRKQWDKAEAAKTAAQRDSEEREARAQADAIASALAAQSAVKQGGSAQAHDDLPATTAPVPPPPPPSAPPPSWGPDPTARHEMRYWDGGRWTEYVSDQGVQAVDAVE